MNVLQKALGIDAWPTKNNSRRQEFIRAFERLLLVSTSGAFFFALTRNVPIHAQEFQLHPDWPYTLDRILRYLSLTWFLAYFFVSSVNNDRSGREREFKDVFFDVCQALAVLSATYALGFVLPERGLGFDDGLNAFILSNAVVALICLISFALFRGDETRTPPGLDRVRATGFVVGTAGALVASLATHGGIALLALLILQAFLWMLWWAYFRIRLDQPA